MKDRSLSDNSRKILETLHKSGKPMTAYELLEKLRRTGIKAPPTVYRALKSLVEDGLVHRIELLGAFVACHKEDGDHGAQFAVCRSCGTVTEIHDQQLADSIHALGKNIGFHIEREMLELMGLCGRCDSTPRGA